VPKFLVKAAYTPEGVKGIRNAGGSSRRDAVGQALDGLGGTLESLYFAFGDTDVYAIADLPDNEAAAALALTINATGAVTTTTVLLLTPEQVDEAAKRSVTYRAPGT
jgi:uncharacterized protein with GYD domain